MSELQIFNYNDNEIRTIEKEDGIWWVANDVCNVFGETNRNRAINTRKRIAVADSAPTIKGKEAVPFPFVRCWTSGWSAAPLLWRKPFNPRSVR